MIDINATLIAQILNFLILAGLLRAVAYKPVVRMLKARQDRIQESLDKADADAEEADKLLAEYKAKLAEANVKAENIVLMAEKRAGEEREAKRAEVKREIEQMRKAAKAEIDREREHAIEQLRTEMITLSMAAAGKIVAKNMDKSENEALISDFVKQLDKDKIGDLAMLNLQLVRKYAKAIFEIAQEEDKLVEYGDELKAAREGIESVPQAIEFFSNPQIDPKLKKELLQKCFKKELSKNVYHFLLLLVDKHRFVLFPAIVDEYRALSNEARGILIADVTTVAPASKKQQKAIADRLEEITGKKVELRLHEDKSLIGGVVVKIGDRRIDGSVAGRLEMMKRKLLANE